MQAILDKTINSKIAEIEPNSQLGQVWTPMVVAKSMCDLIDKHLQNKANIVLDPAVGPTTFIKCLHKMQKVSSTAEFLAFDVDPRMICCTKDYLFEKDLKGRLFCADYILTDITQKIDLAIMNPPYIRHEKIPFEQKTKYRAKIAKLFNQQIDGKSNLYIYFLLKALYELKEGGLLCAIVYDGLNNSRYGKKALEIIKNNSNILSIQTIKTPFENVIVDASIILLKKVAPKDETKNKAKNCLKIVPKNYIDLNTLVNVKRGTGLLNAKVFMADKNEPFYSYANTFVKKRSKTDNLIIPKTHPQKAYFFKSTNELPDGLSEWLLKKAEDLSKKGIKGLKGLKMASSISKDQWCLHKPVEAPIIFNYYIRKNIRHLYNPHNLLIADNFYGITPKHIDAKIAWILLNSTIYSKEIMKNARTQGNGLFKLQLYEYQNVLIPDWRLLSSSSLNLLDRLANNYLKNKVSFNDLDKIITKIIIEEINI